MAAASCDERVPIPFGKRHHIPERLRRTNHHIFEIAGVRIPVFFFVKAIAGKPAFCECVVIFLRLAVVDAMGVDAKDVFFLRKIKPSAFDAVSLINNAAGAFFLVFWNGQNAGDRFSSGAGELDIINPMMGMLRVVRKGDFFDYFRLDSQKLRFASVPEGMIVIRFLRDGPNVGNINAGTAKKAVGFRSGIAVFI